ncbi:MAG: hypothetical protein ACR2N9_12015, partial [Acidimicrobiia bacterium]
PGKDRALLEHVRIPRIPQPERITNGDAPKPVMLLGQPRNANGDQKRVVFTGETSFDRRINRGEWLPTS